MPQAFGSSATEDLSPAWEGVFPIFVRTPEGILSIGGGVSYGTGPAPAARPLPRAPFPGSWGIAPAQSGTRLGRSFSTAPGSRCSSASSSRYSFLYERAFSIDEAVYEHSALEHALVDAGVTVLLLKQFALEVGTRHPEVLEQFRREAQRLVRFSGPKSMVERSRAALKRNLSTFDVETLLDILVLRPSIRLERHPGSRAILPRVELDGPLANLYFLRDQQALTGRGFVLGRMSKPPRRPEPGLTGLLLRSAGATLAGEVRSPGTFEGGDFLPLGTFALIGTGTGPTRVRSANCLRCPWASTRSGSCTNRPTPPSPATIPTRWSTCTSTPTSTSPGTGSRSGAKCC